MENINLLLVFFEGVLAFLSPCILPLLPVYISILANSDVEGISEGKVNVLNSPLLKNTILFVLGIATTFFILGSSITALQKFITVNKPVLMILGGILIIIMGAFYFGIINIPFLQRERKFHYEFNSIKPLAAYILGFTFSFGWTPCIGPMLASILIMASGANSIVVGNLLIIIYTIGFTMPFLIIAVFYKKMIKIITYLKKNLGVIQKIGGILLILSGILMLWNGINEININNNKQIEQEEESNSSVKAPDFKLVDQYGNTHEISEYKGKVVFLNFWATWCPPCRMEMPHIEEIYSEYGDNNEDVVILGVASPNVGKEGSKDEIVQFLEDNNYTFPVVFDDGGYIANKYYISALPTTYIINKNGDIEGYVTGALDKETMKKIIEDTLSK